MKKGFTLVELLGVVVLLSIIIVIVMPNIINSIKKANRNSDIYTASIIYSAIDNYMKDYNIFEEKDNNTYCLKISDLTSNGYLESPVRYNDINDVENIMSVKATFNKKWNYSIVKNSECHTNVEYVCNRVETPTVGFTPVGNYQVGDEYTCKINNSTNLIFLILSVNGDNVNLIAKDSLSTNTKWYTSSSNLGGPSDAYSYINTATSSWNNIPPITSFDFIDTVNNCTSCGYNSIFVRKDDNDYITTISASSNIEFNNLKARLPMRVELENIGCTTSNDSCPSWVGDNFYLNDSVLNSNSNVNYILSRSITSVSASTQGGIKPVIELNKYNLE